MYMLNVGTRVFWVKKSMGNFYHKDFDIIEGVIKDIKDEEYIIKLEETKEDIRKPLIETTQLYLNKHEALRELIRSYEKERKILENEIDDIQNKIEIYNEQNK